MRCFGYLILSQISLHVRNPEGFVAFTIRGLNPRIHLRFSNLPTLLNPVCVFLPLSPNIPEALPALPLPAQPSI